MRDDHMREKETAVKAGVILGIRVMHYTESVYIY